MKILFWNTHHNSNINPYLASLVKDYAIDILVLAEYKPEKEDLTRMIQKNHQKFMPYITTGCGRIKIFGNYLHVEPSVQDEYYSIQIIRNQYILCGAHLPSNLHGDKEKERCLVIQRIVHDLHDLEKQLDSYKTIIVGDFNEMPYGDGCLGADTFHGLPVYEENSKESRIVMGNKYRKFYNPMWNYLGDFKYPPGTYYWKNSDARTPMWYMLDQFIVGWNLVPFMKKNELKIITSCSIGKLMDRKGHPDKKISDHFPIMCGFED